MRYVLTNVASSALYHLLPHGRYRRTFPIGLLEGARQGRNEPSNASRTPNHGVKGLGFKVGYRLGTAHTL